MNDARSARSGRFRIVRVARIAAVAAVAASSSIVPTASQAQHAVPSCADAAALRPEPRIPRTATLFALVSSDGDTLRLAAAPIDSSQGVTLALRCNASSADSTVLLRVPTRAGDFARERLRVAPRFSAPPDSALAARMARESGEAAAVSRASAATPPLWRGPFVVPRPSRITSRFGGGRVFNGEVVSRHMGTDYAGAVGAPVRATNRGIVRLVGRFYLGGNVVYVDHGAGLVSAYLHLSRPRVAVGDTVMTGTLIGDVGATGRVTGPHLHFITRLDSVTVDPASVLGRSLPHSLGR